MGPDLSAAAGVAALARRAPGTVAVTDDDGAALTAGDLDAAAGALAGRFAADGLGPGDRVAWAGRNDPGALVVLLAAQRLGAVPVPLSFRWTAGEAAAALRLVGAQAVVVHPESTALYKEVAAQPGPVRHWYPWGGDLLTGPPATCRPAGPDETAVLLFSSGTSGAPRAAVLSHANLWWSARNLEAVLGRHHDDVTLAVAPLCHVGGLNCFTLATLTGGGTVAVRRSFDAARTLVDMAGGVRTMFGVPAMYAGVARQPGFAAADLSGVRAAVVGGAPTPASLLATYRDAGLELVPSWGMTELSPAATALPAGTSAARPCSVGWPLPYLELRLVDPGSRAPVTTPGAVGEIWARGPQVFAGYWRDPDATAAAFDDGWLRTGDLATRDADGSLQIVGRLGELINTGGEKVQPAEVEQALEPLRERGVREVAVVGVPDETWGEVVVAVLEADRDTPDLATVRGIAAARVARHKLPKHLVVVDALPRTAAGKVDRRATRALAADACGVTAADPCSR